MKKKLFADFGLLARNRDFRSVFIARTISLLGLGMLSVAVPMQIHALTGDPLKVGTAMAVEGAGMFIGLLLGGVLADRWDRRRLILAARFICGLGFLGLAANAWLPEPSLPAIYVLAAWDGFFGALGVTALMACMPVIVGRENLMQARAISMVTMRLATVISPAIGGALIALAGVGWCYLIAALGTGLTLLPLLRLPAMLPHGGDDEHPLRALAQGFRFLVTNAVVAGTAVAGTIVTLATAVRVLFPALAESQSGVSEAVAAGLMYSAVPLGATLGALVSGWTEHLRRPGRAMMLAGVGACACVMLLGLAPGLPASLVLLVGFGYLVSVASLLQYALVQGHTPDHYLGRVNGLWTAQEAGGDALGSVGIGMVGKFASALTGVFVFGATAAALGLLMLGLCRRLREAPLHAPELMEREAA
ncbi:enterobactin transporter EntS [Pseudoduganella plicata]|uniref:Multidrug efflux pump Tap n=1 Tax=Pseudoduganella plicata TaxID=321984 RepID=A0A4P7BAB6_9BURK|nr:enterobactin transporter EntS [Pseudoduganella plicata]QBQ34913.1 enterobactin transporter EntS [Pseudoduganella plicata]GGY89586.1 MFS transporter [Pseudoduganella plicata]